MRLNLSNRTVFGTILSLWIAGLAVGAHALWRYSVTPGGAGASPKRWPSVALIQPQAGRATLVMIAHPRCPCTRASLSELERIMAKSDADAWVVFVRPDGAEHGWEKTELWDKAAAIPGVRVVTDSDGGFSKGLGAETSGHVLFYDASGELRFSGGITASRGHEGPSAGGDAVLAAMRGEDPSCGCALTFGCSLNSNENSR